MMALQKTFYDKKYFTWNLIQSHFCQTANSSPASLQKPLQGVKPHTHTYTYTASHGLKRKRQTVRWTCVILGSISELRSQLHLRWEREAVFNSDESDSDWSPQISAVIIFAPVPVPGSCRRVKFSFHQHRQWEVNVPLRDRIWNHYLILVWTEWQKYNITVNLYVSY